jgi:hypothetical protein
MVVCTSLTTPELMPHLGQSKVASQAQCLFALKKILLQPIRSSTSGRPDRALQGICIHTTDRKNMVLVSHLTTPELIPRLGQSQKVAS